MKTRSPVSLKNTLRPVRLQISTIPKKLDSEYDDTSHYLRREDFAKIYEQPHSDITDQEMLKLAKQEAENETKNLQFQNEEEREEHVARHGNIIGVIGNAGIGKTTSAKKWILQFDREEFLKPVTFLFFIIISKIDFKEDMTLLRFLLSSILPQWKHTKKSDEHCFEKIMSDPNVVIVIDGLDEAAVDDMTIEAPSVNAFDPAQPLHILLNLLSGTLLPYARIIVTSRPNQFYRLHFKHRPKFVVEIRGLDEKSQDDLGHQICTERYEQIKETLQRNISAFTYCHVPVNFILTVHYLAKNADVQFVSMTEVLSFTYSSYSRGEPLKGKTPQLASLAQLAWNGFYNKQVLFEECDFKKVNLDETTVHSFMNTSLLDTSTDITLTILDGDKRVYFSHLIWQEFFAAVHLMFFASRDHFKEALQHIFEDRWEVVTKFLYGLCNESAFQSRKCSLKIRPEASLWKDKKFWLKNAASSYVDQQITHNESGEGRKIQFESIQGICSWIHEANDQDVTSAVVPQFPDHIFLHGTVLPSDVSSLYFVLHSSSKPWSLEVDGCNFVGNAMERFCLEASGIHEEKLRVGL